METAIAVDNGNNSTKLGDTHALIMLPADCMVDEVVATNPDGTAARWTQCQGYIDIELDQLDPDSARIGPAAAIAVYVHRSTYTSDCQPAFAVFAYSGMPDHVPGNNYWWWRKHCSIEGVTSHPTEQPLPTKQQR
ncbi:MAG: hypothetical protein IPM68_19450 [Flavobacteriales bacterium]|nr:hypothetical protein [Flavobacteriales bacterium]